MLPQIYIFVVEYTNCQTFFIATCFMKKSLYILLVALSALVLTSCCACRKAANKEHKPLLTTAWVLVQMDGRNVAQELSEGVPPRIILADDGSFGGYGGCNSMGGQYRMTPAEAESQKDIAGTIELSNVFSTKRMCPNDKLEMEFFRTLSSVDAFTIDGNKLLLLSQGELKLVFEAQAQ